MTAPRSASWFSIVGNGLLVTIRTVNVSTTSTEVTSRKLPAWRLPSLGSRRRSMLNFTASASSSSPLWNLTPLRSLNSHVVGFTIFHDSASHGVILRSSSRKSSVS